MLLIEHYFKKQNPMFAPQKRTQALLVKNYFKGRKFRG